MTPTIEFIYDLDCPNVSTARAQLMKAIAAAGTRSQWVEWDRSSPESPAHARRYGSPTILINGRDVAGEAPRAESTCCRLYTGADGRMQGVPSVGTIAALISAGAPEGTSTPQRPSSTGWKSSLGAIPGIAFAFLPKIACPACWPAYAGFFSSIGLGFLVETRFLLPLMIVFLAIALGALALRARNRRGLAPFWLGTIASAVILVGRFGFGSDTAMYVGIGMLIIASFWNAWPRRQSTGCPSCQGDSPININTSEVSQ